MHHFFPIFLNFSYEAVIYILLIYPIVARAWPSGFRSMRARAKVSCIQCKIKFRSGIRLYPPANYRFCLGRYRWRTVHLQDVEIATRLGTDGMVFWLPSAGPDFAGYQSIIRLTEFCQTGTGVRRLKYKAVGTCRKI